MIGPEKDDTDITDKCARPFRNLIMIIKLKPHAEAVGEAHRRDKIMNEREDYLTNSVSSRRGTLVVGPRIVSAHHPFQTENTHHAG